MQLVFRFFLPKGSVLVAMGWGWGPVPASIMRRSTCGSQCDAPRALDTLPEGRRGMCIALSLCAWPHAQLWSLSCLPQRVAFHLLPFYGHEYFLAQGHPSGVGQSWGRIPSPPLYAEYMTLTLLHLVFLPPYRGHPDVYSLGWAPLTANLGPQDMLRGPWQNLGTEEPNCLRFNSQTSRL